MMDLTHWELTTTGAWEKGSKYKKDACYVWFLSHPLSLWKTQPPENNWLWRPAEISILKIPASPDWQKSRCHQPLGGNSYHLSSPAFEEIGSSFPISCSTEDLVRKRPKLKLFLPESPVCLMAGKSLPAHTAQLESFYFLEHQDLSACCLWIPPLQVLPPRGQGLPVLPPTPPWTHFLSRTIFKNQGQPS